MRKTARWKSGPDASCDKRAEGIQRPERATGQAAQLPQQLARRDRATRIVLPLRKQVAQRFIEQVRAALLDQCAEQHHQQCVAELASINRCCAHPHRRRNTRGCGPFASATINTDVPVPCASVASDGSTCYGQRSGHCRRLQGARRTTQLLWPALRSGMPLPGPLPERPVCSQRARRNRGDHQGQHDDDDQRALHPCLVVNTPRMIQLHFPHAASHLPDRL